MKVLLPLLLLVVLAACASNNEGPPDTCVRAEVRSAGMVNVVRCVEWRWDFPKKR